MTQGQQKKALLPEIKDMTNSPQLLNMHDRAFWMLGWNECRDAAKNMEARIAELEAELEAIGAGGVQSLRKQAAQGLEQFIEQAGDVHFQRCRFGSATGAIRWDIEFGHYGSEVRGKTLQEAIAKAVAAQAKQGGV